MEGEDQHLERSTADGKRWLVITFEANSMVGGFLRIWTAENFRKKSIRSKTKMNGKDLLPEFDLEVANTRKALERVPNEKLDFKPHEKSWSMRELAGHLAHIPCWTKITMETSEIDVSTPFEKPEINSQADLLSVFDTCVSDARNALQSATEEDLSAPWSLKMGDTVAFTMPKISVLRSFVLNHSVHHRGQLTIYLRLLDIPLPSIYGPSADEDG